MRININGRLETVRLMPLHEMREALIDTRHREQYFHVMRDGLRVSGHSLPAAFFTDAPVALRTSGNLYESLAGEDYAVGARG